MKKIASLLASFILFSVYSNAQSVGIGTTTPTEKLEVNGNAKADTLKSNSLKIAVNAGIGKVLTSDAGGVAGWQTAPGAVKALNGLNKSNDSIKLGGLVSENTLLRLNANSFLVTDTGTVISLSISQPNFPLATGLSTTAVTQTFTATGNATLASIELYIAAFASSSITVQIRDASNILLGTVTNNYGGIFNNWSVFNVNNILLTTGQQYSLSLTCTGTTQIQYDNTNPYAGGSSSIGATADFAFKIFSAAEKNLFFLKGNKIGINNIAPTATLDITGTIKINDGTQGAGKLLISDASGNATWQGLTSSGVGGWGTNGNGAITASNFIGTTDNNSLVFKINNGFAGNINTGGSVSLGKGALFNNISGNVNAAIGDSALFNNTSGSFNSAFGVNALYSNKAGFYNTATGKNALYSNDIGINNTANGQGALYLNTTGNENTAIGAETLFSNVSGSYNTSMGKGALHNNTEGSLNTANGVKALYANTTGVSNTASGIESLFFNTTGSFNSANGASALFSNETGSFNSAYGSNALFSNTTGSANIAIGRASLRNNTAQSNLIAIGDSALYNNGIGAIGSVQASENTALGNKVLFSNTTGNSNTANGYQSLYSNTTGSLNNAYGSRALFSNTTGSFNVATGSDALNANTSGSNNAAYGVFALYSNTTGANNIANGHQALYLNSTGSDNSATGHQTLFFNTTGSRNTANGYLSLFSNTSGNNNTANGYQALLSNTTGSNNVATGFQALFSNTTGSSNTANGYKVMHSNTGGFNNTAAGFMALFSNTTGVNNTAIGLQALYSNTTGTFNTAVGNGAGDGNTTGIDLTAIGSNTSFGSNNLTNATAIGANAVVNTSNSMVLGNNVNVGIGTSAPRGILDVFGNGNIFLNRSTSIGLTQYVYMPGATNHGPWDGTNWTYIQALRENFSGFMSMQFRTTSNGILKDVLALQHDGRVGININGNIGNPVTHSLTIRQHPNNSGILLINPNYLNNNWETRNDLYSNVSLSTCYTLLYNGGVMGWFRPTDGGYTANSDRRLKENIKDMEAVLPKLLMMKATRYNFINDKTKSPSIGFMAQDIKKIFPEVVDVRSAITDSVNKFSDPHGINYSSLSVIAIKAIQELHQELIEQKKNNGELKIQNEMLIKRLETLEKIVLKN